QLIFIRKIMKQLRIKDISLGMCLREISLAKNNLISPEELKLIYEGDKSMVKIADIYDVYDSTKAKRFLLDFDDLLIESYKLLSGNEEIRNKYRETYKHLLVDEFQDTNPLQIGIMKTLISGADDSSFWTCGDDWQSIYAFTGASIGTILKFKDMFPGAQEVILNMNYRSTPQILKGCQNLIKHNQRKIEKTLRTENSDGEDITVLECFSEEDEALKIVSEILDVVERRKYQYKDIVVLYRANFQSRVIEETFSRHKIPYHIENGFNFYNRPEVRVLLDYLKLIVNPNSEMGDEALLGVINVPNRYIGKKFTVEL